MATVLRTEFIAFAYWGGKEVVILTDGDGNTLTDENGVILTAEQVVSGLFAATQDWLTDRRFLNGSFTAGNTNAWADATIIASPVLSYDGTQYSPLKQNSTSLDINDPDMAIITDNLINLAVIIEHVAIDYLDTGASTTRTKRRGYICVAWTRRKAVLTLSLEDLIDEQLEKTYPQYSYKKDDTYLPDLLTDDVGKAVPYVIGRGTKVHCPLIKNREILAELLTDGTTWFGDFATNQPTYWSTVNTNEWTIASNKATFAPGDVTHLSQAIATTKGGLYGLQFTLNSTAGNLQVALTNVVYNLLYSSTGSANKVYRPVFTVSTQPNLPDVGLMFIPDEDFAGSVSAVSLYSLAEYKKYNFVFNGTFDKGSTFWTAEGASLPSDGWLIDDDWQVAWKQSGSTVALTQDTIVLPTSVYAWLVQFYITMVQGSMTVSLGGDTSDTVITATGIYRLVFIASTDDPLSFIPSADCFCALNDVVVHPYTQTSITNLVTNGTFASASSWSTGDDAPWTVDTGEAVKGAGSSHYLSPKPGGTLWQPTVGKCYKIGLDYTCNSGYLQLACGGVDYSGDMSSIGNKLNAKSASVTWYVTATTTEKLKFIPSLFFDGTVDNVTVKECTPYIYGLCEKPDSTAVTVSSVYKSYGDSGVIIPSNQYVLSHYDAGDFNLHTLEFNTEQVDFSGNRSIIYADIVRGSNGWNAATEVARLLTWAGMTTNSTSLTAAEANATTYSMVVDWAYGHDGQATTLRAILEQLLLILRGCIYTDEDNSWVFWQDVPGAISASFDESLGDAIELLESGASRSPSTIKLGYRPNINADSNTQFTLERVIGALPGEVMYEAPMLYDFASADRLHCYLTQRALYNSTGRCTLAGVNTALGAIISITPYVGSPVNWLVVGQSSQMDVDELSLLQYHPAVYQYTAGDEPENGTGYLPDYSQTRPNAPTDLSIDSYGGDDTTSWIDASCTPPSVNFTEIWFQTERVDNNTIAFVQAQQSGDKYSARISNLAHNQDYILYTFAKNQFGLYGTYSAGLNFVSYGLHIIDLPVPANLNIRNDDTPAYKPIYADWEGIAIAWDASLDYRVKAYAVEVKKGLGGVYAEVARVTTPSYEHWVYAPTDDGTYYVRVRATDSTYTQYSDYTDAVSYEVVAP